jgi:hypothetical protein
VVAAAVAVGSQEGVEGVCGGRSFLSHPRACSDAPQAVRMLLLRRRRRGGGGGGEGGGGGGGGGGG